MDSAQKSGFAIKNSLDLLVLVIGLCLTFLLWKYTNQITQNHKNSERKSQADSLEQSLKLRLEDYNQALNGFKGFFSANKNVSREQFDVYFKGLNVREEFPGLHSFSYVKRVPDSEVDKFTTDLKNELQTKKIPGQLNTLIAKNEPEHYIVSYVAYEYHEVPTVYGLDLLTSPERRQTLEKARDTGVATSSPKVILKGPEKPGFIITTPLYKDDMPTGTVEERRSALAGFINATFVYTELLDSVFEKIGNSNLSVRVKDGNQEIYSMIKSSSVSDLQKRVITINGRDWEFEFINGTDTAISPIESEFPQMVLVIGSIFSLLLFGTIYAISSTEGRATEIARRMTSLMKEGQDRLSAIISLMGEGLLVVDNQGKISLINLAAQKLFQIKEDEAIGKHWTEIADAYEGENKIPLESRVFYKVLKDKKPITTHIFDNHYYYTKLGNKFPVASTTNLLEGVGAVKVFRDVTLEKEQRQVIEKVVAERTRELQLQKARLSSSIQSLALGFLMTDREENIITMNPVFEKILNLSEDVTKFSSIEDLFKSTSQIDIHQAHAISKDEQRVLQFRDVAFGAKFLHLYISPIFISDSSEYIGSVFLIEDDTERKILERSKDEFFTIASHELRTPLTAIRGNASLIKQIYGDKIADKDFSEMLDDIHASSIRLISLVNDFLDVSLLEQKKTSFKKEPFDILKIISDVINEMGGMANTKKISIDFIHKEETVPSISADPDRVRQVIFNLIGNAVKYTDQGSITIETVKNKDFVKVRVTDTGRGIPLPQQPLLFHKFQQAGSSLYTRDATQGSGLGLYISKLLTEGMGGIIELEKSEEGKGSTFSVSLPIAKD